MQRRSNFEPKYPRRARRRGSGWSRAELLRLWPFVLFPLAMVLLVWPFLRTPSQTAPSVPAISAPTFAAPSPAPSAPLSGVAAVVPSASVAAAPTPTAVPSPVPTATPEPTKAAFSGPTAVPGSIGRLPILMYHYVRVVDPNADPLGFNLSVTPESLAAQLDWIAAQGYTTLTMAETMRCLRGGAGCPTKPIALTFDDGYDDAYTQALPLLQQRGMVATFYIVTGFVNAPGYVTEDQVRALRDAGMEIGAHTVSHRDLSAADEATAREEIVSSKQTLEAWLGQPVTSFCYPAGKYNEATLALVREAGFDNATTVFADGTFDDPLQLPRQRIRGDLGQAGFEGLVAAYTP